MLGGTRLYVGGIVAMLAGFLSATGMDGMALQGVGVFHCGLSLVAISAWAQVREERTNETSKRLRSG